MALGHDIRFGLRVWFKNPGIALLGVLTLALGIGANTMVFAIYNGALLKSLPFENPRQVISLTSRNRVEGYTFGPSYPDFAVYRDESHSFTTMTAFTFGSFTLSDDTNTAEALDGNRVSAGTFSLIGQTPLLGRDFNSEDTKTGAERVVILSNALWQVRYGKDPSILGKLVRINGQPTTVIGVMREGMRFPEAAMLWIPFLPTPQEEQNRGQTSLNVMARLREGISIPQARVEIQLISQRLASSFPDTNKNVEGDVRPYIESVIDDEDRQLLQTLVGAVAFVLLIACANVANLLLSRAVFRSRETSIRTALGASRWVIVRQLLIESILLGFMGGFVGLFLADLGVRIFSTAVARLGLPYWMSFSIDATVFVYLFGLCFLTGIVFGLAPALQISRVNVNDFLKEGGRGPGGGRRSHYLTGALVIVEIALTMVLMIGGGLMIRSFLKMQTIDVGIRAQNLLTARIRLINAKYPQLEDRAAFADRLIERLRALPGMESLALASAIPGNGTLSRELRLEDRDIADANHKYPNATGVVISPGYFETVGAPIRKGRDFTASDGAKGYEAAIVNERFADEYWPGEDPIGKRIQLGADSPWISIIGVAPPISQNIRIRRIQPLVYLPLLQQPLLAMSVIARTHVRREDITPILREELRRIDSDIPLFNIMSIQDLLDQATAGRTILSSLFSTFAIIALVLSSVGIYAVTAYSVSQRTQEIGVRMALGADGKHIVWLILRQGLRHLAIGLPPGLVAAFGLSRLLSNQLYQVTPSDPLTFFSISAFMIAVVLFASLVPARRASRLNAVDAFR
jgi:putative ABC transport system permease protein